MVGSELIYGPITPEQRKLAAGVLKLGKRRKKVVGLRVSGYVRLRALFFPKNWKVLPRFLIIFSTTFEMNESQVSTW